MTVITNNTLEFRTIVVQTRCTVTIEGDVPSFTIQEHGEKANWIDVCVIREELIVYTKPQYYGYLLLNDDHPKITIVCNGLMGIKVLDKAFVCSNKELDVQKLGLVVRKGHLDLFVNAMLVDCTVLKQATATLQGSTLISYVLVHQQGIYDGKELDASEAYVHLHNNGQASAWVTEEIELSLFGRSKMRYVGNPRMKVLQIDEGCSIKSFDSAELEQNKN